MDMKTFSEEWLELHHFVEKLRDTNSVIYTRIQNRNVRLQDTEGDDGVRGRELHSKLSTLESRFHKTDDGINYLQTTLHTLENKIDGLKTVLQRKVPSTKNISTETGNRGPVKMNDKNSKTKTRKTSMITETHVSESKEDIVIIETESRGCDFQTPETQNQLKSIKARSNKERDVRKTTNQFMVTTAHDKPRSTSKTENNHCKTPTTTTKYSESESTEQLHNPRRKIVQSNNHGRYSAGLAIERYTKRPLTLSVIGFKRRKTSDEEDNRVTFLQNPRQFRVRRKDVVAVDSEEGSNIHHAHRSTAEADVYRGLQDTSSLTKTELKPDNENSHQGPLDTLASDIAQESQRILTDYMERIATQATSMRQEDVYEEEKKAAEALLIWNDIADRECRKVLLPKPPRGLGPDTVLCFDTSNSMGGRYLREMKEVALTLIRGIEVISEILHIQENISVVAFGGDSQVLLHLTNDYQKVKSVIESLKVNGSTPMSAGLLMSLSGSLGNGTDVTIADIPVKPRIILFSDGKGTPLHWKAPTDDYDENNYIALANAEMSTVSTAIRLNLDGYTVFCVPIGDANMRTLEAISRLTQGKIFQTSQIHRLVKTSQNMVQAAHIVKECKELKTVIEAESRIRRLSMVDSKSPPDEDMEDIFDLAITIFKRQLQKVQDTDISEDEIMQNLLKQFKIQQSGRPDQESGQQLAIPGFDEIMDNEHRLQESLKKWQHLADVERLKGVFQKPRREDGPDTVLLLDTSHSMEGKAFHDMISLALKVVDGIQHVSATLDVHENIAVATFGKRTEVAIHLTNDYSRIKQTIKSLKPEGLSPVFAGLLMSVAGYRGNGSPLKLSDDITLHPRIILISDGKATPDYWNEGEDSQNELNFVTQLQLETTVRIACQGLKEHGVSVYCVPVGDADQKLLELISRNTFGKLVKPSEVNRLVEMSQNLAKAVDVVAQVLSAAIENEKDAERLLRTLLVSSDEKSDDDTFHLALNMYKKRNIKGDDDMEMREFDSEMPPIGTRVRRGPDWSWPDFQDKHGPGTVISHDSNGMLWVEWDLNAHRNSYFYKHGRYDVVIVDEERILRHDEDIAVGCPVSRGKDWSHGDKDGGPGSVGVVCRVKNKNVLVRWPNKNILQCRFGDKNSYDVKLYGEIKRYTKEEEDRIRSVEISENKSIAPSKADNRITITKRGDLIESSNPLSSNKLSVEEMNRRNAAK